MGLDVALVHGLGFVLPFDDDVGLGEPDFHVAQLVLEMAGDVAALAGVVTRPEPLDPETGSHVVVKQRRVLFQRVVQVQHHRQHFVVHLD